MPIEEPKHEIFESPYRISWRRVGRFVIPLIFLMLAASYWFVYIYIPSKIEPSAETPVLRDTEATGSAKQATGSAKKDETGGWKVYSNTKFGFSLKYPSNYKTTVEPGDIGDSVVISAENSDFDPVNVVPEEFEKGQHIIIFVQEFPGNKTLDDVVKKLGTDPLTESPQSTKIGGVDAVRLPYDFEGSLITDFIIAVKNNKIYSVVIWTALSDQDKLTQASKNILSTFQFID